MLAGRMKALRCNRLPALIDFPALHFAKPTLLARAML
jgi:hypothetical protein